MVLERYPDAIIDFATNPVSGIQRVSKWPPSIAEVVSHCDDEVERLATMKKYREMRAEPHIPWERRNRANVYVPADNVLFPKMVDRARTAEPYDYRYDEDRGGIWVVLGWFEQDRGKSEWQQFTLADLERLYPRQEAT